MPVRVIGTCSLFPPLPQTLGVVGALFHCDLLTTVTKHWEMGEGELGSSDTLVQMLTHLAGWMSILDPDSW